LCLGAHFTRKLKVFYPMGLQCVSSILVIKQQALGGVICFYFYSDHLSNSLALIVQSHNGVQIVV
jgi:hypothetical protein